MEIINAQRLSSPIPACISDIMPNDSLVWNGAVSSVGHGRETGRQRPADPWSLGIRRDPPVSLLRAYRRSGTKAGNWR